FELGKAGRVAARPRQACDNAGAHRIYGLREHDWHSAARLSQRGHNRAPGREDHVRRKRDQLRRVPAYAVGIAATPANIDAKIAAHIPTELLHALLERGEIRLALQIVACDIHQDADAPHPLSLLRARRERPPCRSPAEQSDELAASHSITSSARAMSIGGTSRPSALAALRFTARSNLVGCSTGRSAGRSPLRMRST